MSILHMYEFGCIATYTAGLGEIYRYIVGILHMRHLSASTNMFTLDSLISISTDERIRNLGTCTYHIPIQHQSARRDLKSIQHQDINV